MSNLGQRATTCYIMKNCSVNAGLNQTETKPEPNAILSSEDITIVDLGIIESDNTGSTVWAIY